MASLLTPEVIVSLATMGGITVGAYGAARVFLPPSASRIDRFTCIWCIFDALTHFIIEGSFLYYSTFGRTVFSSQPKNAFAASLVSSWVEYSRADRRWGVSDPNIVSLEILTVGICGPIAALVALQIIRQQPIRHYWIVTLSSMELYGGFMTFAPELLVSSPNLSTSNFLHLWIYLCFFNLVWVIIPGYLMWDSYKYLSSRLQARLKLS